MNHLLHNSALWCARPSPLKAAVYFLLLLLFLTFAGPVLLFPSFALLMPVYMLTVLASVGPVPCILCLVLALGYAFIRGGMLGGICLSFLVLPALTVGSLCLHKKKSFIYSLAMGFTALFAGSLAALCAGMALCQGSLNTYLTAQVEALLRTSSRTDTILLYGYMSGLLPLSGDIKIPAIASPAGFSLPGASSFMGQSVLLNPQAREQLLSSLLLRFETGFCRDVPGQLLSGSIIGAVLLQTLPRRVLRRRSLDVPSPDLRLWFIPAGYGRVLLIPALLAALWLMGTPMADADTTFTYTSGAYIAFTTFYNAARTIFALQGLALLDHLLYRSGKRRAVRTTLVVAGYILLSRYAALLGMADQYFDFRNLRKPPEDDNHDEQEDDF